jgi:hypothetical protein
MILALLLHHVKLTSNREYVISCSVKVIRKKCGLNTSKPDGKGGLRQMPRLSTVHVDAQSRHLVSSKASKVNTHIGKNKCSSALVSRYVDICITIPKIFALLLHHVKLTSKHEYVISA